MDTENRAGTCLGRALGWLMGAEERESRGDPEQGFSFKQLDESMANSQVRGTRVATGFEKGKWDMQRWAGIKMKRSVTGLHACIWMRSLAGSGYTGLFADT